MRYHNVGNICVYRIVRIFGIVVIDGIVVICIDGIVVDCIVVRVDGIIVRIDGIGRRSDVGRGRMFR